MADTPDDFIMLFESNVLYPPVQLKPSITPNDYLATGTVWGHNKAYHVLFLAVVLK